MKIIPRALPGGQRRRLPWSDTARGLRVPLLSDGDLHEGYIEVPKRLVKAPEHSNAALEFNRLVGERLQRWIDWKAKKGWEIVGLPKVSGPHDPPVERTGMEAKTEDKWYWVRAKFRRTFPQFVLLDDFLEIRDQAKRYGVDLNAPKPASTPLPEPVDEITDSDPPHDPLKFAEERRQRLGLKRKDLLIGKVDEPLSLPGGAPDVERRK